MPRHYKGRDKIYLWSMWWWIYVAYRSRRRAKYRENELSDTVEFFDGNIDLKEVFESELEAFKSDYFYCEKCKNL